MENRQAEAGRGSQLSRPCPVGFAGVRAEIESRVRPEDFADGAQARIARAVILMMAEVAILPPAAPVSIGGNKLPAEAVQAVFALLGHDEVAAVIRKYLEVGVAVRNVKSYIRTALYNEAMEHDAALENGVRQALLFGVD